jgi:hypothetical protein
MYEYSVTLENIILGKFFLWKKLFWFCRTFFFELTFNILIWVFSKTSYILKIFGLQLLGFILGYFFWLCKNVEILWLRPLTAVSWIINWSRWFMHGFLINVLVNLGHWWPINWVNRVWFIAYIAWPEIKISSQWKHTIKTYFLIPLLQISSAFMTWIRFCHFPYTII